MVPIFSQTKNLVTLIEIRQEYLRTTRHCLEILERLKSHKNHSKFENWLIRKLF
jgi:hypothetical protein